MSKVAPLSAVPEDLTDVLLLQFESGQFGLQGEGITTVTFASTDDLPSAAAWLKGRLQLVAAANPWLCGTIVKEPQHGKLYALRFPKIVASVDAIFMQPATPLFAEDLSYVELITAIKKQGASLPIGKTLFKTQQPVFKCTVAPSAAGLVMVVSLSHMIANGGTYTQILNMLASEANPISALSPVRKQACHDQIPEIVGKSQYAYMMGSVGSAFNAIGKLLCGGKPTPHCFLVDDSKLAAARTQASSASGAPCSANDVLTSGFGNVVQPRLLNMACDFKRHIDGLSTSDAGNYHLGLYFDPQGYARPGGIREAITRGPPMSRAALPGCCEGMTCKTAIITSWAGFKGLHVPGCTQTMHVPCADIAGLLIKALDGTCIVFNPLPSRLAMLCCVGKGIGPTELCAGLPLGEPLSAKLWPAAV
eukprot:CAMPEP_0174699986 /NCGR_PEP_ID=MMETSP1094-20130205/5082_1 /TAXON_ID=156173 /ORGANISM="Chrysochromulina brevifilum, Strain UTEX LB 985" /LENGTH=419 /DNA_ID=CAMNT_0015897399 /DNA_START=28 /DNA_END=1287 /DNA_ORIENTATION=+